MWMDGTPNRMWCVAAILCATFCINSAEDNIAEIQIKVFQEAGELKCEGAAPVLILNKPFQVFVDYPGTIYRARCHTGNDHDNINVDKLWKEKKRTGYVSTAKIMTLLGYWHYQCEIYTKHCDDNHTLLCYYNKNGQTYEDKGAKCIFQVRVVRPEDIIINPTGFLTANTESFNPSGTQVYHFFDGVPVNFACHRTTGGFVKLSYTTKAGRLFSTDFQPTDSVDMYMQLTAAVHNDTVLECAITDQLMEREHVIRLRLMADPRDKKDIPGFKVNGLSLPHIERKENAEYYYEYKYYHGELLTVGVEKNEKLHGDATCSVYGANVPFYLTKYFNETAKPITKPFHFTLYQGQTNVSIICTMLKIIQSQVYITITFIYHDPDYNPFIDFLSMAKVLMKFTNTKANTIQYDYLGNETLNIKCIPLDRRTMLWNYTDDAVITPVKPMIGTRPFQLAPNRNFGVIICSPVSSPYGRVTYLELIRRREVETTTLPATTTRPPEVTGVPVQETSPGNTGGPAQRPIPKNEERSGHAENTERPEQRAPENTEGLPVQNSTDNTGGRLGQASSKGETREPKWINPNNSKNKQKPSSNKGNAATPRSRNESSTKKSVELPPTSTELPVQTSSKDPSISTGVPDSAGVKPDHKFGIIAAAVAVILVVTAVVLWITVDLVKSKKRHQNNPTDIDYQNLPQHNEGPMPTPDQWESRAENTRNIENLYAKPVPKSERNTKIEPMYTEAHDAKIEPTYASVQNEPTYASVCNSEPTYASAQKHFEHPKSIPVQRTQDPTYAEVGKNNEYQNLEGLPRLENELTYAEIYGNSAALSPKRDPVSSYSTSPVYGQIMPKELKEQKYENVQELKRKLSRELGSGYANINAETRQTEPAYCNVKKLSGKKSF